MTSKKRTIGLRKGGLAVITARPGGRRTSLALGIAANAALRAKAPKGVGIFSLGTPTKSLMERMASSESGVTLANLRSGHYPRARWESVTGALERISLAPIFFDDSGGLSVRQIGARARKLAARLRSEGKTLGLIIVDDFRRIRQAGGNGDAAGPLPSLKLLAKELDAAVVALGERSGRPMMRTEPLARRAGDD